MLSWRCHSFWLCMHCCSVLHGYYICHISTISQPVPVQGNSSTTLRFLFFQQQLLCIHKQTSVCFCCFCSGCFHCSPYCFAPFNFCLDDFVYRFDHSVLVVKHPLPTNIPVSLVLDLLFFLGSAQSFTMCPACLLQLKHLSPLFIRTCFCRLFSSLGNQKPCDIICQSYGRFSYLL